MDGDEEEGGEEGAPAWMATFADMMSLLLCFFVLLLSFATVDIMKFEGMVGSMRDAFGVKFQSPGDFVSLNDTLLTLYDRERVSDTVVAKQEQQMRGQLRRMLDRHKVAGSVSVLSGKEGLVIRVDGDLLFGPGRHAVTPSSFAFLDEMASILRGHGADVSVEGHSDSSAPGQSYASNFELSSLRALAVLEYLIQAGSVPPRRLRAVGYGDTRPVFPNTTPEHRRKNRRVEFTIHQMSKGAHAPR